jgi:ankyrin repeat protein
VNVALLFRADGKGRTPLNFAACKHSKVANSVIELAKECGISAKSLTSPDRTGNSPLHYAAIKGDGDSVEAILNFAKDSGVDATGLLHLNVDGKTPLHCAAMKENSAFDSLLSWAISSKVPMRPMLEADSEGRSPLHWLADFHLCDDDEREDTKQILEIANQSGQMHVVLGPDRSGQTPLHLASYGSSRVVEAIIQSAVSHGKDMVQTIFAPDDEGQTPLHIAVENDKLTIAREIMQTAAELGEEMVEAILAPDKCGNTPLRMAITAPGVSVSTQESVMLFALENKIDWRTLIDTEDADIRSRLNRIFQHQIIWGAGIRSTLFPSRSL